ncbi:MAG: penicillin acylase family protein [Segetibacter sp.]|nr:penicillin acylase family protein [Segetibacter sp.]
MKHLLLLLIPYAAFSQTFTQQEIARYKKQAQNVTIIRDTWGIPHVYGKTDADAVFGLMYAQCEDDFKRVERNYLQVMGRLAEADGESRLYNDLQMKLIEDTADAIRDYRKSPAWFQKLLVAFADGVNFYLATHQHVTPAALKRFEPWYGLMFTDGSIGATQTGGLTVQDIKNLYAKKDGTPVGVNQTDKESSSVAMFENSSDLNPVGSNGFALAPSKTLSKNAILYINPHVTFYFRPEVQMVSDEGLNAYGAVTWGQFFVYQGFNEHCGWMHTSSIADVADLYEEKIVRKGDSIFYQYDNSLRPVTTKQLVVYYKNGNQTSQMPVTAYYTHHGPVMGSRNGKWLSLKENNRSLDALMQSWLRTKAKGFEDFEKTMQLRSNNSNNTVFADAKGNIAYWHGNFMPIRDPKYDWSSPVDGSTSATDWKGIHPLNEVIHVYNPKSGFIQNCNSTPFTSAGNNSPKQNDYPAYMAPDAENFRAINAVQLLSKQDNFTIDKVIAAGYDRYLSAFDVLLPALLKAYQSRSSESAYKTPLTEPIQLLKSWDKRSGISSIATTLAIEWGYKMLAASQASRTVEDIKKMAANVSSTDQLKMLSDVIKELENKFGTWKVTWGEMNRYQRPTSNIDEEFSDEKPSLPVGMASSTWGSLPAFEGRNFPNTKRRYGVAGNSFVAAIEFGKTVKAKSVLTGGEINDSTSKHFTDQAPLYIEGKFKDVWFYKNDVLKHIEKNYHPGE